MGQSTVNGWCVHSMAGNTDQAAGAKRFRRRMRFQVLRGNAVTRRKNAAATSSSSTGSRPDLRSLFSTASRPTNSCRQNRLN